MAHAMVIYLSERCVSLCRDHYEFDALKETGLTF